MAVKTLDNDLMFVREAATTPKSCIATV